MGRARRRKEKRPEKVLSPQTTPRSSFLGPRDFPVRPLAALFLLSLLATLIYSNTFSAPFVFDDIKNIVDNPQVKDLKNFLYLSGSRYVGFLSFALNHYFGGLHVVGYHLVNLFIHITNGFLVYSLVLLLFKAESQHSSLTTHDSPLTTVPWIALAAAMLFVAHPIQTQAVTYIVQRFASLVTLFYLLTVVCYLKWRLASSETRSRYLWYGGAVLSTVLAMKTKENSFTLPFMILLVEAIFFRSSTRKRWLALLPFLLTLPIIPLSHPGAMGEGEAGFAQETTEISRSNYLFTQFRVIVTYLRLLFLPIQQNLDYDYRIYHSILEPAVLFSFLFLLSIFVLSLFVIFHSRLTTQDSQLRLMGFGMVWFFLTLSIESSIIPIKDVIFEHRLYLPSVGFFMALSIGAMMGREWLQRQGIPAVWGMIGFGVIVMVLSATTYQRNLVWHDGMTLWQDVVEKAPQKARGYNNLGNAMAQRGELVEAIKHYREALRINPAYVDAHNNLGNAMTQRGELVEAVKHYREALRINPAYVDAHNNLGNAMTLRGELVEAMKYYREALRINPASVDAHNNLGTVMLKRGELLEAIKHYREALRIDPASVDAYNNLGNAMTQRGELAEAMKYYREALQINPASVDAHYNLGTAMLKRGELGEAMKHYREVLRINPAYVDAHNNLGTAMLKRGELGEAMRHYREALRINPASVDAHYNLGAAMNQRGEPGEAMKHYREALRINPAYALAHNNIGVALLNGGKPTEAIEPLCQALRLGYGLAEQNLKLALTRGGERDDVVKRCREPQRDMQPRPTASVPH